MDYKINRWKLNKRGFLGSRQNKVRIVHYGIWMLSHEGNIKVAQWWLTPQVQIYLFRNFPLKWEDWKGVLYYAVAVVAISISMEKKLRDDYDEIK